MVILFTKKEEIYDVGSFTALKTWIFQDHQNIRKIELYQVDLHDKLYFSLYNF